MERTTIEFTIKEILGKRIARLPKRLEFNLKALACPVVYIFYDAQGAIQYVGYTSSIFRRMGDHLSGTSSLSCLHYLPVSTWTVQWFIFSPGEETKAREVERDLIRTLQPPHNAGTNKQPRKRKRPSKTGRTRIVLPPTTLAQPAGKKFLQ